MHYRRLVCLLLGSWLGCAVFMTMVATRNFRSVDRLLAAPAPQALPLLGVLGHDGARALLRYQASELNRWYFETWDTAQLVLAALVVFLLLFATKENKFTLALACAMLTIVVFDRFLLTPLIVAWGRALDFVSQAQSPERTRFWMLHGAYSGLEVVKWLLGLALAVRLLVRSSGNARLQVDVIDKPDYGHVDR